MFNNHCTRPVDAAIMNGMSDDSMDDFWHGVKVDNALRRAPDGPVTRLAEADYIRVKVRVSTGVIIAYTPTHGLYDRVTAGERFVQWVPADRIQRI